MASNLLRLKENFFLLSDSSNPARVLSPSWTNVRVYRGPRAWGSRDWDGGQGETRRQANGEAGGPFLFRPAPGSAPPSGYGTYGRGGPRGLSGLPGSVLRSQACRTGTVRLLGPSGALSPRRPACCGWNLGWGEMTRRWRRGKGVSHCRRGSGARPGAPDSARPKSAGWAASGRGTGGTKEPGGLRGPWSQALGAQTGGGPARATLGAAPWLRTLASRPLRQQREPSAPQPRAAHLLPGDLPPALGSPSQPRSLQARAVPTAAGRRSGGGVQRAAGRALAAALSRPGRPRAPRLAPAHHGSPCWGRRVGESGL